MKLLSVDNWLPVASRGARGSQEEPGGARRSQEEPGGASQEPGGTCLFKKHKFRKLSHCNLFWLCCVIYSFLSYAFFSFLSCVCIVLDFIPCYPQTFLYLLPCLPCAKLSLSLTAQFISFICQDILFQVITKQIGLSILADRELFYTRL